MSADEVVACSHGEVTSPETYNHRTYVPERWGLYCEEIFGPVAWKRGELAMDRDERAKRWGHLVLTTAVEHPVKMGAMLTAIPVVPPAFRRFRRMQLEGGMIEPDLDTQYRAIIHFNRRATRLAEIAAPNHVVEENRACVREAVRTLFDKLERSDAFDPATRVRALALHDPHSPSVAPVPKAARSLPSDDELRSILIDEVPEIRAGLVSITSMDHRRGTLYVKVTSSDADIDAVGACHGIAHSRSKAIVRRLGGVVIEFERG